MYTKPLFCSCREVEDLQISLPPHCLSWEGKVFLEICFLTFLFRVFKSVEKIPAIVLFALSVFYTGFFFY